MIHLFRFLWWLSDPINRSGVYWALVMSFVRYYLFFRALPCAPVPSCLFQCIPVHSCVFHIHPNRHLSGIICLSRTIMWVIYAPESAFIVYLSIPCILDGLNWPLSDFHFSCDSDMSKSPCLYLVFFIAYNQY